MPRANRARPLLPVLLVIAGLACGGQRKPSPGSGADPLAVATTILEAYRAHDWPKLASLVQPSLRSTQSGLDQAIADNFVSWRAESIAAWDGTPPTEVRFAHYQGPHAQATEALVPYGRVGDDQLATIRLVRERGTWWFSKLVSPPVERYQAMAATLDEAVAHPANPASSPAP